MNPWEQLFGSETKLLGKGDEVLLSHLANKEVVGLYFSAHWCPPCRQFTPKLATFYNEHHSAKNFEIVFVSSDRDAGAFNDYYKEMPWLALPYADRDKKQALAAKYKVQGIPTLVLLDKHGNTITTKAVQMAQQDPAGSSFPWKPRTTFEILNGLLVNHKGEKLDTISHLKATTAFAIYFSAHWCGPCKAFTPTLIGAYKSLKDRGQKFEVIFVSGDNSDSEFTHYFETMPWTAIPFSDKSRIDELNAHFDVEGIPHLVVIDSSTGKVITDKARMRIMADPEGKEFPWYPKALNTLEEGIADINEKNCFILLDPNSSEEQVQILQKIATDYFTKWKELSETPLVFLHGKTGDIATKVKKFTNVPDKSVSIISIPEGKKFVFEGTDFGEQSLRGFIESYLANSLKSKGIKE